MLQMLTTLLSALTIAQSCAQTPNNADASTEPASDPAASVEAQPASEVEAFLDELEARGKQLQSVEAKVRYTTEQGLLGDTQTRIGKLTYHAADPVAERPVRFNAHFTHLLVGRGLRPHDRKYIFDGTWLAEVHVQDKQFIRTQVVEPGESYDPLELGKGPFPLPLGQKREQVLTMFEAELLPTEADGVKHLQLKPKLHPQTGKPFSEFNRVDLWYDTQTLLPTKVRTTEGEGGNATVTTVVLKETAVDQLKPEKAGELFDTTPPATGWQVEVKPLKK